MRPLQPCGTSAAYQRHLKAGEKPCAECRAAGAAQGRASYRKNPPPRKPAFTEARWCRWCESPFVATMVNNVFCSPRCRSAAKARQQRLSSATPWLMTEAINLADGEPIKLELATIGSGSVLALCPRHGGGSFMQAASPVIRFCGCGLRVGLLNDD